jgi:hypothetical protein
VLCDGPELSPDFFSRFRYVLIFGVIHHLHDEAVAQLLDKLATAAAERTIIALCVEPLLDHGLRNPVGWLIAKLDRGRWVRTAEEMTRLLGPHLTKTRLSRPRLSLPVPGGTFELVFPARQQA